MVLLTISCVHSKHEDSLSCIAIYYYNYVGVGVPLLIGKPEENQHLSVKMHLLKFINKAHRKSSTCQESSITINGT